MSKNDVIWCQLNGYDGRIFIARNGAVLRNGLHLKIDKTGRVALFRRKKLVKLNVARTVLSLFRCPRGKDFVVEYKDGNKQNCTLANLNWKPKRLRLDDPRRKEWYSYGQKNGSFKAVREKVVALFDMRADGKTYEYAARSLGMTVAWAIDVCKGKYRKDVIPSRHFRDKLTYLRANQNHKGFSDAIFARMLGVGADVVRRCPSCRLSGVPTTTP